jgi:hypothetical protein
MYRHFRRLQAVENEGRSKLRFDLPRAEKSRMDLFSASLRMHHLRHPGAEHSPPRSRAARTARTRVGMNAVLVPRCRIGSRRIVAAGAVVSGTELFRRPAVLAVVEGTSQEHGPLDRDCTPYRRSIAAPWRWLSLLLVLALGASLAHAAPCPELATLPHAEPAAVAGDCFDSTGAFIPCGRLQHRAKNVLCAADTLPSGASPQPVAPMNETLLPRAAAAGPARYPVRDAPAHPVPRYLRFHRLLVAHPV